MQIPKPLAGVKLTYPSSQPFPENWRLFSIFVYAISAIIIVILAVLNSALVGYETVTVFDPNFNLTQKLWFDRFRANAGRLGLPEPGTLCAPQTFSRGTRFATSYSIFEWHLVFVDGTEARSSFSYKGSTLQSCDVQSQYLFIQENSAALDITVSCQNISGSQIYVETSLSANRFRLPSLSQLGIPQGDETIAESELFIREAVYNAWNDFLYRWNDILSGPIPHPVTASMDIFSDLCPASSGAALCSTQVPPYMDIDPAGLDIVSTNGSRSATSDARQLLDDFYITDMIFNLAQTMLAAVRIDFGNPTPNNFLLNSSVVNETLSSRIDPSSDSRLYYLALQGMPNRTSEGPATIQTLYSCRKQNRKSTGSAFVSVLVATSSMFMSGWVAFMFISSRFAERSREKLESAEQIKQGYRKGEEAGTPSV